METPLEYAGRRFSKFALDVLQPAVWRGSLPLTVEAAQFPEAIGFDQASASRFEPVQCGWHWGPAWSTCWFRVRGEIPRNADPRALALRFSSGTEATLWIDGSPRCGLDRNRDAFMLADSARPGQSLQLHIEAACNHPFGTSTFWWDPAAERERWDSPTPGRLERCELATFDPSVWRLWRSFEFARLLMAQLAANRNMDSGRAHELCAALTESCRLIDDRDVARGAAGAQRGIDAALHRGAAPSATRCIAVGHAHIDTAWLWPIRETRRKCIRSWTNVLRLMEQFPSFNFLCSQAQQYAWLEHDSPPVFQEIKQRVAEGRWEPLGAMWIEPDCNCTSGESLVRQIIHGTRWWRSRFGDAAGRQRLVYLPDTFGFPASLPQIMKLAGIDTFITNKLSWNERNEFPHVTFNWRGLDGTEILSHCTPGHDYNASNTPLELRRGETNMARKDRAQTGVWLQPFGFGDGGGGPIDWQIQNAIDASDCEGLPRVELSTTARFLDELHATATTRCERGDDLPVWDGELYLELHRGTFTSQAFIKRANRRAEQRLRIAEWLMFAGPIALNADESREAMTRLDEAWKITLLNQFHDILPGSSIAAVYEDARNDHARVAEVTAELIARGAERWAEGDRSMNERVMVFNPTSRRAAGVVECDGGLVFASAPAIGAAIAALHAMPEAPTARGDGRTLSNRILSATIDDAGRIASLRLLNDDREACARAPNGALQPLNQLMMFEDRPRSWEAWDVDADYALKPTLLDSPAARIDVVMNEPLRTAIEVERSLGARSRITQRYVLDIHSPRLDIQTRIDWREDHRLLRALFPVEVRSRFATFDTQFGHIQRSTTRNNSVEQAMYEVCAHQWMDLSEHGFGVAILNDGKYGHSCDGHVMGLTLLRSPKWPDPTCDMGVHEFTYSIMPHAGAGGWREAGVDHQAALLNAPLFASSGALGDGREEWSPLVISGTGANAVMIAALKRAEDHNDSRLMLRLVETHGGAAELSIQWHLPVRDVATVNLLEEPMPGGDVQHDTSSRQTTLSLRPFQIITMALTLGPRR